MTRLLVVLFLVVAAPSFAQTTADLQAIAAQAAAQYGVPVDVLDQLIQAESSWNPNIGCNSSNACGLAQFIPGTAAQYGVDVNDPTSSLYGAAHYLSDLQAQKGSWVAALTAYSGGCTPSVPCNAAYAQAFADAAADDSGGTSTSTGPGGDTLSNTNTADPTQGDLARSASIFSFLYNKIILNVLTRISQMIDTAIGTMWRPFLALLTLAIVLQGYRTITGDWDMADLVKFVIRCAIIVGFMSPSTSYFANWIESPLLNLPTWFASIFDSNTSLSLASPVSFFDSCAAGLYATAIKVWNSAPWSLNMIPMGITIFFTYYLGYLSLFLLFLAFLFGNFLVFIIVIIVPFILPALLFRATTGYFVGWLNTAVTALLTALLINIILGLYFSLILDLVNAFNVSGSSHVDLPGFVGLVTGLLVMGVTVIMIPKLARAIGHGVTASFEGASRAASGQMLVSHATAAGRVLSHV